MPDSPDAPDGPGRTYEPWTPVQCETVLAQLYHAVGYAELAMRKVVIALSEAERAYERAHIIAATDPECPVPNRGAGGATVGMRDSWIRAMCEDEYAGLTYARDNLEIQKNYQRSLSERISIVQTMARLVMQAYAVVGAS